MSLLINLKKLGVNTTVLATSISLVACGGGGSDGYYDQGNVKTPNNGNESLDNSVKEATGVSQSLSKSALNVNGDELTITAKAVDKDGGGVAGKTIVLNIADYAKSGATSDASEKVTDEAGNVTFKVTLDGSNKNLASLLFTTTIKGTTINDIKTASVSGAGTVVSSQYELVFDSEPLAVSGGESVVRVRALDLNGGGVPNENITLAVKDFKNNQVTIKGSSNSVTDNEGYALFTLALKDGREVDRKNLIETGVFLEATLTEKSGAAKTQVHTVGVNSVANIVSNISILTSNSNKVDAIGGSINVVVKARNPEGNAVKNKTLKLTLDDIALEYGAKLVTPTAVTNDNGEATFIIKTEANAANPGGHLLVTNGINISAALIGVDNTPPQISTITVVSTPAEEVSYLNAIVSEQVDIQGGQTTVTITAKDKNGGSIANKQITLNIPSSQTNGLTIINGSKITTDSNGQAKFNLNFDDKDVSEQVLDALLKDGVTVTAGYTTTANTIISQTTKLRFYKKQTIEQSKEVERLELTTSKGVVSSTMDSVQIKVRAIDTLGKNAANKLVTIGLSEIVMANGVTLEGTATKTTDEKGFASFTLNVNAHNKEAVEKLVASGITVAITTKLADGTSVKQNTQVMVEAVTLEAVDVSYLAITADQMINIDRGQATITVKAVDSNGGKLADQDIILKVVNSQTNGLTLDSSSKKTDKDGNATFVISYDGHITDEQLLAKLKTEGVDLVATYQPASGKVVTQTSKVRFYQQAPDIEIRQLNISLDKGVVVASKDTVEVKVKAVDAEGQSVSNRKVNLELTDIAKQNGASIEGALVQTIVNGEAKFTVKLAAPNTDAINALVNAGLLVTASAYQSNGSIISQAAKIMVVASHASQADIAYLSVSESLVINVDQSTEKTITVTAFNSIGEPVSNKDIELGFDKTSGLKIKEGNKLTTNATGETTFTLVYDASKANKAELIQKGLIINAQYGNITQTVKASFYQQAVNIQRMDLVVDKAALIINTTDSHTIKVEAILKDTQGVAIKNRQVTLAIDNNALQNGVSFKNSESSFIIVNTDEKGIGEVELIVKPMSAEAVTNLVASGIGISASVLQGDGNSTIVQNTKINVVSAVSLSEVSYLKAEASDTIKTTGGSSTITVKAFNSKGTALSGKSIKLNLAAMPAGLNIKLDAQNKITNTQGEASFKVIYTASATLTEAQVKALLAGLQATAIYNSEAGQSIAQTTLLQFNIDETELAKDASRIDLIASKGIVTADSDTFTVTTKVFDKNGELLVGKKVGIGLSVAAVENGVTVDANQKITNASGEISFTVNVKASDEQKIQNLIANGITFAASVVQADGSTLSQNTKIMVKAPQGSAVHELKVNTSHPSISGMGGSSVIAVQALDEKGKPVINQLINFALAGLNSRVKVDQDSAQTNSQGFAYFVVNLENGELDDELIKKGIIYAVTTTNKQVGNTVSQVGKVNISVPEGTYNLLPLNASKPSLLVTGDTVTITSKLVDEKGRPLKSQPVTLEVRDVVKNGGLNVEGGITGVTDSNGNVSFNVTLPANKTPEQIDELLNNGLSIKTSVRLPNGNTRTSPELKLVVEQATNLNILTFGSDKWALNAEGDKAVVNVVVTDVNGNPISNEEIKLVVKQTASTTATNVGIDVGETDLEPQRPLKREATVNTDQYGNGFFTIVLPQDGRDKDTLVASGIQLEASHTNEKGITNTVPTRLAVYRPVAEAPQIQDARYTLRISKSKPILNVRNDMTDVIVTLLDRNGGGVTGQYVTLEIPNFENNGASIVGASGLVTDENGQAIFKVKVDETARDRGYSSNTFVAENLRLITRFNEIGYREALQEDLINIVQSTIISAGNITFGNASELQKSLDGLYYIENLSAHLVDNEGRPIPNQDVTLNIKILNIAKGHFKTKAQLEEENQNTIFSLRDDLAAIPENDNPVSAEGALTNNQKRAQLLNQIQALTNRIFPGREQLRCAITPIPTDTALAPAFIDTRGSETTTASYITDNTGRFDLQIRYLRKYAGWQNVSIRANVTLNGNPISSQLNYSLGILKSDIDAETSQPFDLSPYGNVNSCQ